MEGELLSLLLVELLGSLVYEDYSLGVFRSYDN